MQQPLIERMPDEHLWWNPATEAQAVDRTHRIGQDKQVVVCAGWCPATPSSRR